MFRIRSTMAKRCWLAVLVLNVALAIGPASAPHAQNNWEALLEELTADGSITKGALAVHEGPFLARGFDFHVSTDEVLAIVEAFDDPEAARASGITAEGTRYLLMDADAETLYARFGSTGLVAVRTERVVVIGLHNGTRLPSIAQQAARNVADVIRSMGY